MGSVNRQVFLLDQARHQATFDSNKLTNVLYDSEDVVKSRRAAFERVEAALGLDDNMKLPHIYKGLNRDELYIEGVRRARATIHDMLTHGHNHFESLTERYHLSNASPFGMNYLMFRKTIELQGTAKQKEYWLPLIDNMKINGCYVQTELGHGTFVRGIETTATFDVDSNEFVIDSPSLTATKYWPGGLGISCSHAVVAAKLFSKGTNHGMHWFVVQIRSLEDYAPIEGVELGDIGMKMAYNATCNGYARFNQLRVPRDSMLAAHAEVLTDGTYRVDPSNPTDVSKMLYATMLDVRCVMIKCAGFGLAQTLAVATRYSVVREQGQPMFSTGDGSEVALLAYKSQHYRLLTLISQAYAIIFASKSFDRVYLQFTQERTSDNFGMLPFIHGLSTGLKAWATTAASLGADEARKMCGGHGYVAMSGLPEMVSTVSATATFEGDNYVMWQQLVRYLFKQIKISSAGGSVDPGVAEYFSLLNPYLARDTPSFKPSGGICELPTLQSIFRHKSLRLLATAFDLITQESESSPLAEAWNKHMMSVLSAGHAFAEYYVLKSFHDAVDSIRETQPTLFPSLERLCKLFALTTIVSPVSTFYTVSFTEDGTMQLSHLAEMRHCINELLEQLLPDIVALTDAWDFTDASLCSALGCQDGNVYERLMSWSRQLPVNNGSIIADAWGGDDGIAEFLLECGTFRLRARL